jgi:hypothetical protein
MDEHYIFPEKFAVKSGECKMIELTWNPANTPENLQAALRTLAEEYPLLENVAGKIALDFKSISAEKRTCRISRRGETVLVEYSDLTAALRAVGGVLGQVENGTEETSFTTFGIMLDCSRNAVMKVDHVKGWLRKLALLGYDMAMLYTEDTYELPGEPYFGYQRGAYTPEEIQEIDQYAARLGIELISCIQTLGHLAQILKWTAYADVKDTNEVLLVDEEKTYALIEKMIKHTVDNFKSKRIHIGMDETHDLGRGRFMDQFGYERGFDIFNRHLARVNDLCKKYNLKPMIWSDMYFRMGSKNMDYYDKDCAIPDDVKSEIPQNVELVYWDYYHENEEFYLDWIQRHRDLGFEPIMGAGIWTWAVLWYGREITEKTAGPCIRASLKAGLKEMIVTMWGDDGAYCEFDSAMAGLAWIAELSYAGNVDSDKLNARFAAVCHADYNESLIPDGLYTVPGYGIGVELLWDDPLLGTFWHNTKLLSASAWTDAKNRYAEIIKKLEACKTTSTDAGDLQYALALTRFLARKVDMRMNLDAAYAQRDQAGLKSLTTEIPRVVDAIDALDAAFRTQWHRKHKPQGLEVIQIRLAGQRRRLQELAQRIDELLTGKIDRIDELENSIESPLENITYNYRNFATGSSIL